MPAFARKFRVELLTEELLGENAWFRDMLLHWRPAGDAHLHNTSNAQELVSISGMTEEDPKRLRLAVRDGYLNMYRAGQSVAKVDFGRSGALQAKIHNKYIFGDEGSGQTYVMLNQTGFSARRGPQDYSLAQLQRLIANANKHIGEEKSFVDLVVGRNPNVIDIEMGLPAYIDDPDERRAPRMDLVALEPVGQRWRIVFWEAKLVRDGRARCKGDAAPKVVRQLQKYTDWLSYKEHKTEVANAYRNVCRLMVCFHEIASRINPDVEPLGEGIKAAAAPDASSLLVDNHPRLLIYNRNQEDASFIRNGHLQKLLEYGIPVQLADGFRNMTLEVRP